MAKKKAGRPKKAGGEGSLVRLAPDLVTKARYLAAQQGVPMSDLLSDWLRPIVDREFKRAGRDLLGEEPK